MTSTPVNVQGFAMGPSYSSNRIQGTDSKGDFSKIFENQKNISEETEEVSYADKEPQEDTGVKETENKDEVTVSANRTEETEKSSTVNESEESGQTSDDTDMEESILADEQLMEAASVLNGAVMDIRELLMQQLQISESELDSLMKELGLTDMDLLQLNNVKELVLQKMGVQDMTALLTDEGLYTQMKSIEAEFGDIMQDVQEALEMDAKELPAVADQVEDYLTARNQENKGTVTVEAAGNAEIAEQPQLEKVQKETGAGNEQNPMQENNAFAQQMMYEGTEKVQVSQTQSTSYAAVETENIMRQIMDHMRIQMTEESTELDMQLSPESLGTLQIKISAKEGIMTAQFTTASETVKSVLEAQMIQLQQQLEQQNIKVEAIEVMVQSHAFESALEKGNEHQTEEETKKNRTRKIDLSNLTGTEEVEEEDRLLAEMMEANGNSVDYLV